MQEGVVVRRIAGRRHAAVGMVGGIVYTDKGGKIEKQEMISCIRSAGCLTALLFVPHYICVYNASNSILRQDGFTALMFASQIGHPAIARLLLEGGADVNAVMKV